MLLGRVAPRGAFGVSSHITTLRLPYNLPNNFFCPHTISYLFLAYKTYIPYIAVSNSVQQTNNHAAPRGAQHLTTMHVQRATYNDNASPADRKRKRPPGGKREKQMTAFIFFFAGFIAALFILDPFKEHIK